MSTSPYRIPEWPGSFVGFLSGSNVNEKTPDPRLVTVTGPFGGTGGVDAQSRPIRSVTVISPVTTPSSSTSTPLMDRDGWVVDGGDDDGDFGGGGFVAVGDGEVKVSVPDQLVLGV
jgi:hypothetical protein